MFLVVSLIPRTCGIRFFFYPPEDAALACFTSSRFRVASFFFFCIQSCITAHAQLLAVCTRSYSNGREEEQVRDTQYIASFLCTLSELVRVSLYLGLDYPRTRSIPSTWFTRRMVGRCPWSKYALAFGATGLRPGPHSNRSYSARGPSLSDTFPSLVGKWRASLERIWR